MSLPTARLYRKMPVAALLPLLLVSTAAHAGVPVACPETAHAADDSPRVEAIGAEIVSDQPEVTVAACIVSPGSQYTPTSVSFSLFSRDGRFLTVAPPLPTGCSANGRAEPSNTNSFKSCIPIAPSFRRDHLDEILVNLAWQSCLDPAGGTCAPGAWHFTSVLVENKFGR